MGRITESHHHITFDGQYPVVFCPKYRRKVRVNGGDVRLKELRNRKARERRTDIVGAVPRDGVQRYIGDQKGH